MNIRLTIAAAFLALGLAACGASGSTGGTSPGGGTTDPTPGEPGVVQGIAHDAQGKPIAGALIWIQPAETTGLVKVNTDADGRYKTKVYPKLPYYAVGWHWVQYRGKELCLRLAAEEGNEAFGPENGVTRNFVWKLSGPIGRSGDGYYGGEARPFFAGIKVGDVIEYTFAPNGPLADGSTGQTIVRKHDWDNYLWQDIPVGAYKVSAVRIEPDGSRTPLKVSTKSSGMEMGDSALLEFKSGDSICGGLGGNGLERAFVWLQTPDYQE
ncbi:MAG: carboxypeptidase-like regulatory domain-containing protein, partial [Meiothermus silvanus]|nr:carboxypeptidase-like regulatory domain-containing protein [Allomeiothermus silvanus]